MKPRLIASVAIGAALVVGTSGCAMISPQATTLTYSAADGVNVEDSGPLAVRNVFIVANEDGSRGNLIAAIVNTTQEAHTLQIEVGEAPSAFRDTIRVEPGETVSLGADAEPIEIDGLDTPPGADVPAYFQSGDAEGALVLVPVLDGTLDYLAPLVPEN